MSPEKGPGSREPRLTQTERQQLVADLTIYTYNQMKQWIYDPNYNRREPFMPLASMQYVLDEGEGRPAVDRHLKRIMAIEHSSIPKETVEQAARLDRELVQLVESEIHIEIEKLKGFENSDSVRGVWQQAYTDWSALRTHLENPILLEQLEKEQADAHPRD